MMQLKNVHKRFAMGDEVLHVLKGISLTIRRGAFVALVGPSGCGKSTLLNLIGGLDRTDSGEILYDGANLCNFTQKQLEAYRLENIGTIFQNFNLIPHMSALENVEVPMTLAGMDRSTRRKQASELLELVGLKERMHHKPNQLSGGQKQRVAIARALALNPNVILADEPTGALDSVTGEQILALLKHISQTRGTTIVMVTHAQEIASQADHIVSMLDGEITNEVVNPAREVAAAAETPLNPRKMSFATAMRHAGTNLIQKKWRTTLVAVGASIGICGIALMVGLGMGIETKVTDEVQSMITKDALQVTADADGTVQLTEEQAKKISGIAGVKSVYNTYSFSGGYVQDDKTYSDMMTSLKPAEYLTDKDQENLLAGKYPTDDKGIALTKKVAQNMAGEGKDFKTMVGKEVTAVIQNSTFNDAISNTKEVKFTVTGIVKDGMFELSNTSVSYDFAKNESKELDVNHKSQPLSTEVIVKTADDLEPVKTKIKDLGFYAKSDDDQLSKIKGYAKAIEGGLGAFAGISLIVSSIMIGIVMYISVLERTKEIGILRAIGARRKDIRRIFLAEAAAIGTLAGVVGVGFGALWGAIGNVVVKQWLKENAFHAFTLPISLLVFCIVFSAVLSLIAGWIPASRASRLNPIDALRYE